MALSFSVAMDTEEDSFLDSLHTLRIMLKGTLANSTQMLNVTLYYFDRVLIACIKLNGKHLCATCKTTHNQALRLGTKLHDRIWASRKRVDSNNAQSRVEEAGKNIYQRGYVADGKAIDNILQDSKTPIRVCLSLLSYIVRLTHF